MERQYNGNKYAVTDSEGVPENEMIDSGKMIKSHIVNFSDDNAFLAKVLHPVVKKCEAKYTDFSIGGCQVPYLHDQCHQIFNHQFRKVTKFKTVFPTNDSLLRC